jgi:hypothetical protein
MSKTTEFGKRTQEILGVNSNKSIIHIEFIYRIFFN